MIFPYLFTIDIYFINSSIFIFQFLNLFYFHDTLRELTGIIEIYVTNITSTTRKCMYTNHNNVNIVYTVSYLPRDRLRRFRRIRE